MSEMWAVSDPYKPRPDSCRVKGCSGAVHARGVCAKHYRRWERGGWCWRCLERSSEVRNTCRSCYEVLRRTGVLKTRNRKYVDAVIEEVEFMPLTWYELESEFGRSRQTLRSRLRDEGRMDLIRKLDDYSFGGAPRPGRRPK